MFHVALPQWLKNLWFAATVMLTSIIDLAQEGFVWIMRYLLGFEQIPVEVEQSSLQNMANAS